jgi:glycosyltransferase involved in cell wall biosynthesis
MPVFNAGPALRLTIESILGQSLTSLEFVIVDDGSSDDSWAIVQEYAQRDGRIRATRFDHNQGHCAASNKAMELARADILCRQDQDDISLPQRLQSTVSTFEEHPDVGLVFGSYVGFWPDGHTKYVTASGTHSSFVTNLVFANAVCHTTAALRRSRIAGDCVYYRDVAGPQDYDLWVRLVAHTRAHPIGDLLAAYRNNVESMTSQFGGRENAASIAISHDQLRALLPDEALNYDDLEALRRLYACSLPLAAPRTTTERLFDAFEALRSAPGMDANDVDGMRRRWLRRALPYFGKHADRRDYGTLVTVAVRRDPVGAAAGLSEAARKLALRGTPDQ